MPAAVQGVIKMPGRATVLQVPPTISTCGKPTPDTVRGPPPPFVPFNQELLSEYERSFRPFEKYQYKNGRWVLRRPTTNDSDQWLNELQDSRRRALENKEKSRGDHFSRGHMLQIPSNANAFWEPSAAPYLYQPPIRPVHAPAGHSREHIEPFSTYRTTTDYYPDHHVVEVTGRRPNSASVAVQTNTLLSTAPSALTITQATQTLPDAFAEIQVPAGVSNGVDESAFVETTVNQEVFNGTSLPAPRPTYDTTRLEILRKAKYVDAKDNAMASSAPPRSTSMRSLFNSSLERGSGFVTGPASRPRSAMRNQDYARTGFFAASPENDRVESKSVPEKFPAFVPGVVERPKTTESRRDLPLKSGNSVDGPLRRGHLLPVSAFTISPPKRDLPIRNEEKISTSWNNEVKKSLSSTWDIPPSRPTNLSENRRPLTGNALSKSALRSGNGGSMKEKGFAWVEL